MLGGQGGLRGLPSAVLGASRLGVRQPGFCRHSRREGGGWLLLGPGSGGKGKLIRLEMVVCIANWICLELNLSCSRHMHTLDSGPHRTFDPDFLEFGPSGKQVRQGVVRKVQYAFASAPLDFVCEADETPVVEAAVRTLYNCKQTLSPYIHYPCPGKGGCTLDYNTTWWVVGPAVHIGARTLYGPAEGCFVCRAA